MISYTWRRYLQLCLAAFGVFAVLVGVVALAYVHNVRVDLSAGSRFTLTDHAHKVLDTVDTAIKVTSFIRTEDPRNPIIKDLLWQVSRENPLISYEVIDVNRNPALAARYGIDAYGATVVESADRRADFGNPAESQLMAAILKVLRSPKTIYFTSGHGECSLANTDGRIGCSQLRDALSLESYLVETANLFGGKDVPTDAAVLVVNGPKTDFLEAEIASLGRYLDSGGNLLVLIDPFRAPRLVGLLGVHGIEVAPSIVLDPDNRLAGGELFSAVITELNRSHLVSRTLESPPLFSLAASLNAREDEESGRAVFTLLKTGPRSWASYDPGLLDGATARFVAGRDINGPLVVGLEVSQPARAVEAEDGQRTRILVYGDSEFTNNRFLDYLGNKDLIVNSANWLAREERLMAPRPAHKTPGKHQFFISQADGQSVFWGAVVIQPLAFLLAAIGLFVWRRMAP